MFPRRRIVAACLALSLLGLTGLFLHAASVRPRLLAIADVGADDVGTTVRLEGRVHRVWSTRQGNVGIDLVDYADFATIAVVARPSAIADRSVVAPGALVSVLGEVLGSSGSVLVFSEGSGAVVVLQPASTNLLPLAFVAENAAGLEGHRVVVRARVADLRAVVDARHARLLDGDGEVWAYAPHGWEGWGSEVTGRLRVSSRGRCELFVAPEAATLDVSVGALAGCPEGLREVPVRVRPASVEPGELLGTSLTLADVGDGAEFRVAAFVEGWDAREDEGAPREGDVATVEGVLEYRRTEARWQIAASGPPR